MNVEAASTSHRRARNDFPYNDAVLRSLVIHTKHAVTEASPMKAAKEERKPLAEVENNDFEDAEE